MLARAHRLTRSADFTTAVRRGRRAGSRTVVVHLWTPPTGATEDDSATARVGLVVGRGVGDAVTRTRVKRRLRHLARPRLDQLPPGALMVLRAQPASAAASSVELGADLDRALGRVLRPRGGAA